MVNQSKILIYDDMCGICTWLTTKISGKLPCIHTVGNSNSENILTMFGLDFKTTEQTVVFIDNSINPRKTLTRMPAVFYLSLMYLNFSDDEINFLFNESFIKLFNPLYRLIAKNRAKISTLFGLDRCMVKY